MAKGDARARRIYQAIGVYLGYGVAHFADFYTIENVLVLGRVTSGEGGDVIVATAARVLKDEFPGARREDPPAHAGREGEAPRPGDRRRQPARPVGARRGVRS